MKRRKSWLKTALIWSVILFVASGFAYTLPIDLALLAAIDMATYFEALVAVALVVQLTRFRAIAVYYLARLKTFLNHVRGRTQTRAPRQSKGRLPNADNDDHPELVAVPA